MTRSSRAAAAATRALRHHRYPRHSFIRHASTASLPVAPSSTPSFASTVQPKEHITLPPRLAARNLLKSSTDLARKALVHSATGQKVWTDRLDRALQDLETPRKPVVAFYGDIKSGSRDLVTALLEEPLSNDNQKRNALVGRHDDPSTANTPLRLSCEGNEAESAAHRTLSIDSQWLRSADAEILEIPHGQLSGSMSSLLAADQIFIVVDNIRFLSQPHILPLLDTLSRHPHLHIVLNQITQPPSPHQDESQLRAELSALAADSQSSASLHASPPFSHLQVHVVSSTLALEAIDAFRSTTSATNVDTYQTKQLASRIAGLDAALRSSLPPASDPPSNIGEPRPHQVETASFLASRVLEACQADIDLSETELIEVQDRVKDLTRSVRTACSKVEQGIFGDLAPTAKSSEPEFVQRSFEETGSDIKAMLAKRYQWWKLPWNVDDLGSDLRTMVIETYGRDISKKMMFYAGLIQSRRDELSTQTQGALRFPSSSPFHSPILLNQLSQLRRQLQLKPLEPTPSQATPITTPITSRREQIISSDSGGVIAHLHIRAQRLVLQMYGIGFGSSALAFYATAVAGYLPVETALGLGALGIVGGMRWGVARWESAKRKFWKDWGRVREGLTRDLKASVQDVLVTRVSAYPLAAAKGLEELAHRRREALDEVSQAGAKLKHDIEKAQ